MTETASVSASDDQGPPLGSPVRLALQPVHVNTGSSDQEGVLVFAAEQLVAVLVRLSEQHDGASGQWYLEHGFGWLDDPAEHTFPSLTVAREWIQDRLAEG